ncbi:MAG: diacylglycerol kinase family protein [Isosphaeraceae bacterium]
MVDMATGRVMVLLNPMSGNAAPDQVRKALEGRFQDGRLETHETAAGEDLGDAARRAVEKGFDVVVAAGGDGSVTAVANALVHARLEDGARARLGILPLGTTNVLARELNIPLDLDEAVGLIAGPNATATVDAMRVNGRYYFTQVGIGVDALMIRDTDEASKKRFGPAAYLWTAAKRFVGFQPRRFSISADGRTLRPRAAQVVLANCGALGTSGLRWGEDVRPDDGRVDVCVVRSGSALDYLGVAWSVIRGRHRRDRNLHYLTAAKAVAVHSDQPLPVQADGEVVGETPVEVRVAPGVLEVVVPVAAGGVPEPPA